MNGPYKGLASYEDHELDALLFVGRDEERATVTANLMASRLTVLYGASGVGKSSLLRAGVVHRLRESAREASEKRGAPELAVVLFGSWAGDPVEGLIAAVSRSLERGNGGSGSDGDGVAAGSLAEALDVVSRAVDGDVYVVLDQFEEYFVYHPDEDDDALATALADAIRADALRANFLVSLRDDALAELDRFAGKLPGLLGNTIRVEHLDRRSARRAIVEPPHRYAAHENQPELKVEADLVEAVLDEVASGKLPPTGAGVGAAEGASDGSRVEAPYLQLVMERLWAAETEAGSDSLRLETLQRLGGARQIVETHFDDAMESLTPAEQEIAARIFGHLVTPSETKIAHAPPDLAHFAGVDEGQLTPVLSSLVAARILRPATAAGGETRFEIFHDVLAEPVLAWKRRFEADRRLAEERFKARRRQRRLVVIACLALVAVAAMAGVTAFALTQRSEAREQASLSRSRELAASAGSVSAEDPELGLLLALEAARTRQTPEAEDALRQALLATRTELVLPHESTVVAVAVTDEGRVVTLGADGHIRWFNGTTGNLESEHTGPAATASALTSNGSLAAAADGDGRVVVTATRTGDQIFSGDAGGQVSALGFGQGGEVLAIGRRDGAATVWWQRPQPVMDVDHGAAITSVAVDPAGTLLATAGRDGVTRLWSIPSGEPVATLEGHRGSVASVAFSHDGRLLATAGTDSAARIVDVASQDLVAAPIGHGNALTSVAFNADGEWLVTTSRDGSARVWETETGRLVAPLVGHSDAVVGAAFDPAGERVVTGSLDDTARVWAVSLDQTLTIVAELDAPVLDASFTSAGDEIVLGSEGGEVAVVASQSGKPVTTLQEQGAAVVDVAVDDASSVLSAGGTEATRWTLGAADVVARYGQGDAVTAAAMTVDGSAVATAGQDGVARIFATQTGAIDQELQGHTGPLTGVAFSPDGRLVATSGTDRTARIWSRETGELLQVLQGHRDDVTSVAFSPDGVFLVTSSRDHDARIWEVAGGRPVDVLRAHFGAVVDASFSPDGRWVVTAGPTTAGLWEVESGAFQFYLRGHVGLLTSASFAPDSRTVVTTSAEGTVGTFRCEICGQSAELEALAVRRLAALGRDFSAAERARYLDR